MRRRVNSWRTIFYLLPVVFCAGCASTTATRAPQGGQAELPVLTALQERATRPQRLSFKKPIRDDRARAMRQLALRADEMLAESESWDDDVRLTSLSAPERDEARSAVEEFRTSLRDLRSAAGTGNRAAVRSRHAAVVASYQNLLQATETEN